MVSVEEQALQVPVQKAQTVAMVPVRSMSRMGWGWMLPSQVLG